MSDIITSKKELAARLGRNPRYVRDMERGGFRLPCRIEDAVKHLRNHPHPTRNRHSSRRSR